MFGGGLHLLASVGKYSSALSPAHHEHKMHELGVAWHGTRGGMWCCSVLSKRAAAQGWSLAPGHFWEVALNNCSLSSATVTAHRARSVHAFAKEQQTVSNAFVAGRVCVQISSGGVRSKTSYHHYLRCDMPHASISVQSPTASPPERQGIEVSHCRWSLCACGPVSA